jgi:hypothetical protein
MHRIPNLLLCASLIGLCACTSLSPSGLIAASRLDPLGTPPDQIGMAVGAPNSVRLASGDVVLRIAFQGNAAGSPVLIKEAVPLQLTADETGIITANGPQEILYLATLLPEDAARFAAAQNAIRAARQQGVEGTGSLNIELVGGCTLGQAPTTLPFSTWLNTPSTQGYVPLTRQVNAFELIDAGISDALRERLHPC